MSELYHCGGCDNRTVLLNSGGVARTLICHYCNCEMDYSGEVETEYIGDESEFDDYQIVRD